MMRSSLDLGVARVSLVRGSAICELSLLGSGNFDKEESLEILYGQVSSEAQRRGLHFNDLSEDHEYELVSEIDAEGDSEFQHMYVRSCGDVLVLAVMKGYEPSDEDEVRQMLTTMESGSEKDSTEVFSVLPAPKVIFDWDRIGNLAIFSGVA